MLLEPLAGVFVVIFSSTSRTGAASGTSAMLFLVAVIDLTSRRVLQARDVDLSGTSQEATQGSWPAKTLGVPLGLPPPPTSSSPSLMFF